MNRVVATLARINLMLFAVSALFPTAVCLQPSDSLPQWIGVADVVVAATLVGVTFVLVARSSGLVLDAHRLAALRITHRVLTLIPVMLAAYFVLGERLNWEVLTIGLGWRCWLLIYCLPNLLAALDQPNSPGPS
ncbi:hypothetical protein [Roseiflexus sp.]|uniref:hypothetical protein n=1 Tax=Roseiflexus sp. TaxID=2562120 RepID=UPI0021DD5407|nr:hypothetical protein [Roseiflexus sp.]GIV98813.1 MAG: hypothetical protein KatS3mg058_0217 [Roseiflexus sp.]